jgi:enoyl-CoA hydratase
LADALELAQELSALPPLCLRSDLRSTKDQWDLDLPDAILRESELGRATILSGETREGASRFAAGAGRHGTRA